MDEDLLGPCRPAACGGHLFITEVVSLRRRKPVDRKTMETATNFIFSGSKITVDSDWSHEIKTLAP